MRTSGVALFVCFVAALSAAACGGYTSYVESEQSALGRVVVYRNGIAYYERRATVTEDRLVLAVPRDKVDDFLKSLTVTDARTGQPLPVSFPTRDAASSGTVEMTIQLPAGGARDVVLSYITEAPAWKPSYRMLVQDDGEVEIEGWAIVDNTSGEDWTEVKVGVGSSSALSFRYDLRSIRNVQRVTLGDQQHFVQAPPTGGSLHQEKTKAGENELARFGDGEIPRPEGHPDVTGDLDAVAAGTETGALGGGKRIATKDTRSPQRPAISARTRQLAQQLNKGRGPVVLEGFSAPGERDARGRSEDRANLLRNQLIELGVAPARLKVEGRGAVAGHTAGVRLVRGETPGGGRGPGDDGQPVGESHFESATAMTVARGTSAMVPILDQGAPGEVVYLYAADAERGNKRYAFKSVRFKNPTTSTLEGGPVTVYGNKRFVGEGIFDPVPPGATGIIPFALDRQVVVEREGSTEDRIARLVTLQRGVLRAEVQHTRRTELKITNRLHKPTTVLVRHTVRPGWELTRSPKLYEKLGDAHLFQVELDPSTTATVVVEEATPLQRTIDLRSSVGVKLVRVYLAGAPKDAEFATQMRDLLAIYAEIDDHRQAIVNLREAMQEYRRRLDELQTQLVSLKAVKAGGNLSRHLERKLQDISGRIQKATIKVVDHQEKLMLARIRFQDGVSELTLARRSGGDKKAGS